MLQGRKPTRLQTKTYVVQPEALRRLRSRTDVIFRPADKGGAFVVKDLYLAEALKRAIGGTNGSTSK